jgi:hypothetical protein
MTRRLTPVLFLALLALGCYADAPLGGEAVVYGEAPPPEPPALQAEVVTAAPSPSHFWVAGHWAWSTNGYAWVAGHWVARPSATAVWVAPHWDVRGRHHIWVNGFWR